MVVTFVLVLSEAVLVLGECRARIPRFEYEDDDEDEHDSESKVSRYL